MKKMREKKGPRKNKNNARKKLKTGKTVIGKKKLKSSRKK